MKNAAKIKSLIESIETNNDAMKDEIDDTRMEMEDLNKQKIRLNKQFGQTVPGEKITELLAIWNIQNQETMLSKVEL